MSQLLIPAHLNPDGRRILPLVTSKRRDARLTPSLSATYNPTRELTAYLAYAEGFKAGGFTQRVFPPEAATPDFGPETVRSYEAGIKGLLAGKEAGAFNLALFRSSYSDMQLIINQGLAPQVQNAGRARINGIEAEVALNVLPWLRAEAAVGHFRARYGQVSPEAFPVTTESRLPNAPAWTGSVSATATLWRDAGRSLTGHVNWTYRSTHYKDANNSVSLRQPGYGLVNANLTFSPGIPNFSVTLAGTNLTDEKYLVSGYSELPIQAAAYGVYGRPREVYLRARLSY